MATATVEQKLEVDKLSTWLEINRDAVTHNLDRIYRWIMPGAEILAVIKSNAYGHVLIEIARAAADHAAYFGVSHISEALVLRQLYLEKPILLFGIPPERDVETAIRSKITLSVSSLSEAELISNIANKLSKSVNVHIKIDTGMGRLGIRWPEAVSNIRQIAALDSIHLEGIYTHFPEGASDQDSFTMQQIKVFMDIIDEASGKGIHFAYRHAANSLGILNYKESHLNLVRPGITLYGIKPSSGMMSKIPLKPVLSWRARIILVKKLKTGESTGYNRLYKASHDTTIGILPVGYSHGYPFALSNRGLVLYRGKRYPIAGQVSMDYVAVDFGADMDDIHAGEVVTLLGSDGDDAVTAEILAERAGTIPYVIVTQLNLALPRFLV